MLTGGNAAIQQMVRPDRRPANRGNLRDSRGQHTPPIAVNVAFRCDDSIVTKGERAAFLFYVTLGTVRVYARIGNGRRQIMGFRGIGSLVGLSLEDRYACSAEAVGTVRARRIPRKDLETQIDRSPHMKQRMLGIVLNELVQAQDHILLLGRKTAMEKLATFLLQQSRQQEADGGGSLSLMALPMPRTDIGDYLGLTTETVSRTFSLLRRDRLIRFHPRGMVEVIDFGRLETVAGGFSSRHCDAGCASEPITGP